MWGSRRRGHLRLNRTARPHWACVSPPRSGIGPLHRRPQWRSVKRIETKMPRMIVWKITICVRKVGSWYRICQRIAAARHPGWLETRVPTRARSPRDWIRGPLVRLLGHDEIPAPLPAGRDAQSLRHGLHQRRRKEERTQPDQRAGRRGGEHARYFPPPARLTGAGRTAADPLTRSGPGAGLHSFPIPDYGVSPRARLPLLG